MKVYRAIVWDAERNVPGKRVNVLAPDLAEAKRKLEAEYGEGRIFDLHNEEEADQPR